MEPNPIQPATSILPAQEAGGYQLYYVIATDMAFYGGDEAGFDGYQAVLASARDDYEACDLACNALEEGVVPVAAFGRADLLDMLDVLAKHPPLPAGTSYNLAHEKSDVEMAELREETSAPFGSEDSD